MERVTVSGIGGGKTINKNIYGHFSEHLGRCIYGGVFVGEKSAIPNVNGIRSDVAEAMRRIRMPVLRWPGGCFADEYHWRDGIGALEARRRMVNTNWGGVVEDNSFGTHEFLELCRQVGCEPYINANVGSGTVREMAEWVEYLNSDGDSTVANERRRNGHEEPYGVKYWGVGNESWGCGGNMRPEFYADEFRRYQTYCRNYGDNKLYRIACGPSVDDYNWMEVLMKNAARFMDGISLHHYAITGSWEHKGSATDFTTEEYYKTIKHANLMDELITKHSAIMDRYDPERRVGLIVDEWGCWHDVEPGTNPGFLFQQNTMRDAIVAALTLNIFNRHCERVVMANLAQTVNVLQAIILTEGERMTLTPTYHVLDMYKEHMDAEYVDCLVECGRLDNGMEKLSVSASRKAGVLTVTAANLSPDESASVSIEGAGARLVSARVLAGDMRAYNTFDEPNNVKPTELAGVRLEGGRADFALPPCSVAALSFDA